MPPLSAATAARRGGGAESPRGGPALGSAPAPRSGGNKGGGRGPCEAAPPPLLPGPGRVRPPRPRPAPPERSGAAAAAAAAPGALAARGRSCMCAGGAAEDGGAQARRPGRHGAAGAGRRAPLASSRPGCAGRPRRCGRPGGEPRLRRRDPLFPGGAPCATGCPPRSCPPRRTWCVAAGPGWALLAGRQQQQPGPRAPARPRRARPAGSGEAPASPAGRLGWRGMLARFERPLLALGVSPSFRCRAVRINCFSCRLFT